MTDRDQIFLSDSRNDPEAAASLRPRLEKVGLCVFKDDQSIREGELWLSRLQEALEWRWKKPDGNRLSGRMYMEQGRLAGILIGSAV